MGWLILLAVLILLVILPLGVSVVYNTDGLSACLVLGPVRLTLYPRKKKNKKPKGKTPEENKRENAKKSPDQPAKTGGSLTDFLPLIPVALDFLGDLRRKLRVKRLEMKLIMAGDDPCDLAVNYGKAWAVLGNIIPHLERLFVIKKRDLQVECDFTAEKTLIYAGLDISITFGRLTALAVRYGIRALREYLKIMKKRKGGAKI